ncbi:ead/Ea22-like family protein [Agrobacterium sp. SUL3]|uniref:ead/Ea22-like family protein n=1 Tax=Agrobacterium sp. SUL3 TaxID=1701910 RepID=UPI00069C2D11|nr:ead/Ea22-like family protein [Agrobacterium sp. SUL3]KNY36047.1 hypothetical protein AKG12_03370 [Agrobacterium sp. SUL3]
MTALEEIKKALEGVTPGPWFEGDKWVFVSPRSGLMDEALENVLRNDEAQANARYIAAVNPAAISDLLSTLKSLQRENERLERERAKQWRRARRADASRDTYSALAKTFEAEANQLREVATANRQRAEAAEAEVKRLRDRYERWMPVTDTPPEALNPVSLLCFYCVEDTPVDPENPSYWSTGTWDEKPSDAVYWCAIMSPDGPHERTFIARQALASTGGEHNGN